jgi:hypothetical protein
MHLHRWTLWSSKTLIASAAAVSVIALGGPASAAPSGLVSAPPGPVSSKPAIGTPALPPSGTEQVRQLVPCGGVMYAVGRFDTITQGGRFIVRHNAFSFSETAPYTVTSWNPDINGKVNSIAFNGTGCRHAYLGGVFTSINGTGVKDIAEVSTKHGRVKSDFAHSANGQVETLLVTGGHLLAGGSFTSVNGGGDRFLASLNPTTGKDDGFVHLNISGNYGNGSGTKVYNQQLSHSHAFDLVEGTFTSVGGQPRQQIFMLNLTGLGTGTVAAWTSPEFDQPCASDEAFYVRAASWSPDDGTVYIGTTGFKGPGGVGTGLCDAAAAFPATQGPVSHLWINYTGCDSFYSTAADASTAYFGGHERWADNPNACDQAGPGAISAPGMVGLSPATGAVVFNPTRSRGFGADDMRVNKYGLWIASDNAFHADACAHVQGHAGICLLPYG